MIRTQIFYINLTNLQSVLGSRNETIKKQILASLGYTDEKDSEAQYLLQGINTLIDKGELNIALAQTAFNQLPPILGALAFSDFADWATEMYWDLAMYFQRLQSNPRLIGYLKMLYHGRRIDRDDKNVEYYAQLNDSDNTHQFKDIPRHCLLSVEETEELLNLLEDVSLEKLDHESQEFLSTELNPALKKALDLNKDFLLIIE